MFTRRFAEPKLFPQQKRFSTPRGRVEPSAATYRLQITMNDVLVVEQAQALDDGVAEAPDEAQAEALVVVFLD